MTSRLRRWVLGLNTAGFALFLVWMVSLRDRAILREQDGILYFSPLMYRSSLPPHHDASNTILESSFVAHTLKLVQTASWLLDTRPTSS